MLNTDNSVKNIALQRSKAAKIVAVTCSATMFLIAIKFLTTFILNEIFINKYENGEYDAAPIEVIMLMNFPEGYIAHYNLGNSHYKNGAMEAAEEEYLKALETVPSEKVCDVRLNLGLTMVAMIDKNSDKLREELEMITETLLEDGCADKNGNGKHDSAQKLYDEIMKVLESGGNNGGNDGGDTEGNPQQNDPDVNEEELEEWLQAQAEEAQNEHNNGYYAGEEYEYYDGKTW